MKIKENTFPTLVLELFFPSIANCKKLKIQKSTSPSVQYTIRTAMTSYCKFGNVTEVLFYYKQNRKKMATS
jgi:hypothetical protein